MPTSIGERIKRVYQKNGTEITPYKDDTLTEQTNEYILTELSNQATKVFIQEFYLKAYFPYDTACEVGDYVKTIYDDTTYLIMNLTNEPFRNEIIQKQATLYKTNTTVRVQSKTEVRDPASYKTDVTWQDKYTLDIPCLITNTRFGDEISDYNNIGQLVLDAALVYTSRHFDIAEFDRLVFASGEVMKVESVAKYMFGYAYELKMSEDNR